MDYVVPLVIRGRIIEDDLKPFGARRGEVRMLTPDLGAHLDELILRNPTELQDLYSISLEDIIAFLDELGHRLSPKDNPHIRKALEIAARTGMFSIDILQGMYESMRTALYRESVEEIVEQTMGASCLEGWEKRSLSDREVLVRAFGSRTLHLNAGNGPPISMFGLVNGSVLRCDNIVKIPSNDPYTATAVALTMIDMAPDHPLTRHLSVAYWKGGDETIEKRLYKPTNLEKIVAWGGFASMGHVRKYLAPGMDLIALDPKISASIVGKAAFASEDTLRYVANQIAKDVGLFNQAGCVNSRTVFVECGTDAAGIANLNQLAQHTYAAIQKLPQHLSCVAPSFDPVLREELAGIRVSDAFRVIGGKQAEGAIIASQESEPVDFVYRLSGRTANLVPVDHIEDAFRWITTDTQTVGVYPESLKDLIRDQFAWRGVQRLTSLGCAVYEGMAYPHDSIELIRRMARWVVIENFTPEMVEKGAGMCIAPAPQKPLELV